ncbi:MAG: envelope stress response membrane protein PspC [Desulfosarcinaceae bacterium]|nr:envelope stress response membrane protein PspC [Desulfosarcinaceae bacterium]
MKHHRNPLHARSRRRLYRSRDGVILGVCKGIATHFDLSLFWTRAIAVFLLLVSGVWPTLGAYLLTALLLKPEPVLPFDAEGEDSFYDAYAHTPRRAAERLKQRYDRLERRLRRLEDSVTAKSFDWDRRLRNS